MTQKARSISSHSSPLGSALRLYALSKGSLMPVLYQTREIEDPKDIVLVWKELSTQ